jgi:hypothetical protein
MPIRQPRRSSVITHRRPKSETLQGAFPLRPRLVSITYHKANRMHV